MISAYTASSRIEGFVNSFGDSGCAAMSTFTAQNMGAGKQERVRQGFLSGVKMLFIQGILLSAVMAVTAAPIIRLLTGDSSERITANAMAYIEIISLFYVLCFVGNAFVGLYRGLGLVYIPVTGTIFHISLRVVLSYLFIDKLGLAAVALATGAGWAGLIGGYSWIYAGCIKKKKG